jgi:class 3 adenylate cyclase
LLAAFAAMAAMTLVSTVVAWYAFSQVNQAVTRITESSVPYMSRARDIAAKVAEITASAPELMASANQEGRTRARESLSVAERELSELTQQLAAAQADPAALSELKSLQAEMGSELANLDRIVQRRLELDARRRSVVAQLTRVHQQALEDLEPVIDDAIFDTVMRSEEITRSTSDRILALVNGAMIDAIRLERMKSESNLAAGLIVQAALTDDRDLLGPLEEKFTAGAMSLKRDLHSVDDAATRLAIQGGIDALLALGSGRNGVFEARRRELAMDEAPANGVGEQRPRLAAAVIGGANKVHEGLQLSLVPIIDDAVFRAAMESEQSVRDNQASLTALVGGGIESLRALLLVRGEANLVAGLMAEASGVTDIDRLRPLKERFTAAQSHVLSFLAARRAVREAGKLEQSLYTLLAFGSDADSLFDLRHEELTLVVASEKAVRKASAIAARLSRATGDLVTAAQKTSTLAGSSAHSALGGGRVLLVLIAAIAVSGASGIILFYIAPRIVRPLIEMTAAMARLASGDTAVEVPGQGRRDEIGDMAEAFKVFRNTALARANLSRYFSPRLVEELANKEQPLGPVRRQNVAVLFADIVGFTRISETQPPEMVMALLRDFHGRMETEVFSHNGVLEKFIGDAMLATFGVPNPTNRDAIDALDCARAMLDSLARWNAERMEVGQEPVRIGIGLNFGPAVLGDIGSERSMAFAVIGDTTNTASRLESLTRDLGCDIVASAAFMDAARRQASGGDARVLAGFQAGEEHKLKGREKKVLVWTFKDESGIGAAAT